MLSQLYTFVLILLALLLLLAFPSEGSGASELYTVFLPAISGPPAVCYVTLAADGSWASGEYHLGEPFPPACDFVTSDGQSPSDLGLVLYEDMTWGPAKECK